MKEFTFIAWCSYGRGDSGESWVDVELTDEEAERLIHFGTQPDIYWNGFNRCKELEDLYKKIYAIAVDQMTEEVRDGGWLTDECADDPEWKVDDRYPCGVNFPQELKDLLPDE